MKRILMIALLAATAGLHAERLAMTFDDNFIVDSSKDAYQQGTFIDIPVRIHVATAGESLSTIAKRFYGDSRLWPIIFYDNMGKSVPDYDYVTGDKLFGPEYLPAGLKMSIRKHLDAASVKEARNWCLWYYGLSEKK